METYLAHHGILGMKWGVRRYQNEDGTLTDAGKVRYDKNYRDDNKTRRYLKRRVAASTKNLKLYGQLSDANEQKYREAQENYRKEQSRVFSFGNKRKERIAAASKQLSDSGDKAKQSRAELNRAERIYDKSADNYVKQVNSMIAKYGSRNVKEIKTKEISIGETHVKNIIKTGLTVVNVPLIGKAFTGRYISQEELIDREKRLNKEANDAY